MKLIALSGKAGSGKDWLTHQVLRPLGFFQVSFADHFKIGTIGKGLATHEEVYHTKPPIVRKFLQEEGTERGRDVYGENIWVDTAFAWMKLFEERNKVSNFVLADVRFPNEADAVRKAGGKVIRVNAPARASRSALTEAQRMHLSEVALDAYEFDATVWNDEDGNVGALALQDALVRLGFTAAP
jgi:hypothetical protein